ncbi:MAG: ABC transporter ATP-binding protein [Ilumatobacteraceae bacterium]
MPAGGPGASPTACWRAHARAGRGWWFVLGTVTLVGAALAIAAPALVATAIDATIRGTPGRRRAVLAAAALAVAGTLAAVVGQLAEAYGLTRTDAWLRRGLVRRILALGPAGVRRFPPGDVVARLDVAAPQAAGVVPKVIDLGAGLLLAAGAFVALARIDWRIVVVIATATPFVVLIVRTLMRRTAVSTYAYQVAQGALATRFVEALRGARTIRACDTVDVEIARVGEPLPDLEAAGRAIWRAMGRSAGQAGLVVPLVGVLALAVAGQGLTAGRLTPGELLAASAYVPAALGLFDHIGGLSSLAVDRASAVRLAEVLAARPAPPGRRRLAAGGGALVLRDVTVRAGDARVLRAVDLDVPAGSTLAVVGRSGAGKSTLALVAAGLWRPDEGTVELDGVDLAEMQPADRAGAIAVAFDVPELIGTTIADALGYGMAAPSRTELHRAVQRAAATTFVERLPDGLDTVLADAPLSGGEHQRLGLARALLRHPRLLVLDDATSSLDTATEAEIQAAIAAAGAGTTSIVVAHRATSAARADAVAWLDGGALARRRHPHRAVARPRLQRRLRRRRHRPCHHPRSCRARTGRFPVGARQGPASPASGGPACRRRCLGPRRRRVVASPTSCRAWTGRFPVRARQDACIAAASGDVCQRERPCRGGVVSRSSMAVSPLADRRVVGRLAMWSAVGALPALVSGRCVELALDRGFLAGDAWRGVAWLLPMALAGLVAAAAARRVTPLVGECVEPFRDALTRRAVGAELRRATAGGSTPMDAAAVARIVGQTDTARDVSAALLAEALTLVATVVMTVIGLVLLEPLAAAIVLAPVVVALVGVAVMVPTLARRTRRLLRADEALAAATATVALARRDIAACGAERRAGGDVDAAIDRRARAARAAARAAVARTAVSALGGHGALVGLLVAAPWLVAGGRLSVGGFLGAVVYVTANLQPALCSATDTLAGSVVHLRVTLANLARAAVTPPTADDRRRRAVVLTAAPALRAEGLSFAHGAGARPIVDGLDLVVEPGAHLAVVGPSGVGKSTLVDLLAGLRAPDAGRLSIGAVAFDELPTAALRGLVAVVPQEAYVFAGTLAANLAYLHPSATTDELDAAMAATGLDGLADRLGGLDAPLDPGELSEGERQLIVATRVWLSPAVVVILDEATSRPRPRRRGPGGGGVRAAARRAAGRRPPDQLGTPRRRDPADGRRRRAPRHAHRAGLVVAGLRRAGGPLDPTGDRVHPAAGRRLCVRSAAVPTDGAARRSRTPLDAWRPDGRNPPLAAPRRGTARRGPPRRVPCRVLAGRRRGGGGRRPGRARRGGDRARRSVGPRAPGDGRARSGARPATPGARRPRSGRPAGRSAAGAPGRRGLVRHR